MTARLPDDETERLAALHEHRILDTPPEEEFDDLARLATHVCGAPIAAVSLIDEHRQWFKAVTGTDVRQTPREFAFCAHTILQTDVMIVPDTTRDRRFADNPLVTGNQGFRFYAGAPLVTEDGFALGSLCIIDRTPRRLTTDQAQSLRLLARQVARRIGHGRRVAQQRQFLAEIGQREELLRRSEAKFRSIIDVSPMPYCLNDDQQNITFLNAEFVQTFGYTLEDIPTLADWWPRAYPDPVYRQWVATTWQARLERAAREGTSFEALEVDVQCKDGRTRTVMASAAALGASFAGTHLVILYDITERKLAEERIRDYNTVLEFQKRELEKANAELASLATTDGLTGLKNHRAFQERLAEEFLRSRRYGEPLSLIVLDVDHFKAYNDTFGHLAGNEVLRKLAEVLREHAHETDLVARFGGEEFALILPHTEAEEAAALAERLRAALEETVWSAQHPITASFGVCLLTPEMDGPDTLVARTDAAMYRAKAGGRNRVAQGGAH